MFGLGLLFAVVVVEVGIAAVGFIGAGVHNIRAVVRVLLRVSVDRVLLGVSVEKVLLGVRVERV